MLKILNERLPKHIGIIIDGNGRWAKKRGLPRTLGHRAGIDALVRTINVLIKYNIPYVSIFAFSTENWSRPKEEVDGLFALVRDFLKDNDSFFTKKNVKVTSMGDLTVFPEDLQQALLQTKEKSKNNSALTLNLALNYGGRSDIVQAVNKLIKSGKKEINEKELLKNLYSADLPEPDFVIRTSAEQRISNFMLYQMAYSELYFPKVLWPDFNEKHLKKALMVYQCRDRRYGGIK